MRQYNIVYKVLLTDGRELLLTPYGVKKLLKNILELEKRAVTDDVFNDILKDEIDLKIR